MRKILAIDCAHGDCSAALSDGEKIISEIDEQMERGQAERLIPMVRDVLKQADASRHSVQRRFPRTHTRFQRTV